MRAAAAREVQLLLIISSFRCPLKVVGTEPENGLSPLGNINVSLPAGMAAPLIGAEETSLSRGTGPLSAAARAKAVQPRERALVLNRRRAALMAPVKVQRVPNQGAF